MQDRQDDMELIKEWDRQAALRAEAERIANQKLPNKVSQSQRFMPKKLAMPPPNMEMMTNRRSFEYRFRDSTKLISSRMTILLRSR